MAQRGGARPGAGRPKGRRDSKTIEREKALMGSGKTPLQFLIDVMRDSKKPMEMRVDAAKSAAPYCHPRLASVQHEGNKQNPVRVTFEWADDKAEDGGDSDG